MRIDRYILPLAIILFFLQLVWLAADMELISLPFIGKSKNQLLGPAMGQVVSVQNKVRQKSLSEIVWTEAREAQDVRAMDAILTLSESSTRIKLNNGSELNLGENTLVYLEPMDNNLGDGRIRIHFAHGQLRSLAGKSAPPITTESWVLTADGNSEVQLKSREDGEVEVQVTRGEVEASSADKKITVTEGEVAALKKDSAVDTFKMSQKMTWKHPGPYRVYAHLFPEQITLRWEGPAQKLRIGTKTSQSVQDVTGAQSTSLVFQRGTYELRLQNENELSPVLILEVWQAPLIHLVSPLPRDRYRSEESVEYLWTRPEGVRQFQWILQSQNSDRRLDKKTSGSHIESSVSEHGPYKWWVEGYDPDGVRIPAPYNNPIFIEPQPLEAPKLNSPQLRVPADEGASAPRRTPPQSWLWILVESRPAEARPAVRPRPAMVELSWETVKGAEFYIVEVSALPDFREPVVETKLSATEYNWDLQKFKGKAFYWRVAAGNSSQMGRFSEAQEVVIAKIGANTPGVKVVELPAKSALPAKTVSVEPVAPAPVVATPVVIQPEPSKPAEPAPKIIEPVVDYSQKRQQWIFSAGYEITSLSASDAVIKFAGLVPSVQWQRESATEEQRSSTDVQLSVGTWRSTLENIADDSKRLTDLRLRARYSYGHKNSAWMKGLTLSFLPFAERSGLEGLLMKSQALLGFALVYDGTSVRWSTELNIGAGAQELRSQVLIESAFTRGSHWNLVTTFEGSYLNTSRSVKGVRGTVQSGFSYEW